MTIAKSELTIQLERDIWSATAKQGLFGCFEVTIGWFGNQRVDYLTYDTKGIWRCYEIKVSKSDFHSKAHNTFIGHYNYYVLTEELYKQVKDEIPNHIGVYVKTKLVKRAKRQELLEDEKVLKDSMIRSLYRESEKIIKSENPTIVESLKRQLNRVKKEKDQYRDKYWSLLREVQNKYGTRWNSDI